MALIDKETTRAEIERLKLKHYNKRWLAHWWARAALTRVEKFLDTLKVEEKDAFCKENCKGYQDTGRCFCDGGCEAKKKSKEKEIDLEKEISNYYTLKKPEIWFHQFHELAHHFYDLGKNARNE